MISFSLRSLFIVVLVQTDTLHNRRSERIKFKIFKNNIQIEVKNNIQIDVK